MTNEDSVLVTNILQELMEEVKEGVDDASELKALQYGNDHKRTTEKRKNFLEKRRRLEVAVLYREAKHRATIHQLSLIH